MYIADSFDFVNARSAFDAFRGGLLRFLRSIRADFRNSLTPGVDDVAPPEDGIETAEEDGFREEASA
jgi:hypothetical protein